jgi:cellulose synthase/poly-beta-1,6-N-acetylglucosamine synthase-like glycosyltransferase
LPETHFSVLTLSGVIMLSVYILPLLLRPLDFLANFRNYLVGMITYIILLPTFINIMQVYSMSNLQDVSWGNRPSATTTGGTNLVNDNK